MYTGSPEIASNGGSPRADSILRLSTGPGLQSSLAYNVKEAMAELEVQQAASVAGLVRLDVGGVHYTTCVGTLCAVEGSYLAALFSGRWDPPRTPEGCIFLDRDGEVFRWVLNYLRASRFTDAAVALPGDEPTRRLLQVEAEFFGLPGLAALIVRAGNSSAPAQLAAHTRLATAAYVQAIEMARDCWEQQKAAYRSDASLNAQRDLLLHHLLTRPLAAKQLELVQYLAETALPRLELTLTYCAFGDLRLELDVCFLAAGERRFKYSSMRVRERGSTYLVEETMAGEEPKTTAHPSNEYKEAVLRYTGLHRLLVQQSPRDKFNGLIHLLDCEGLGQPRVLVEPHTYQVSNNTHTSQRAVVILEPGSSVVGTAALSMV